MKPTTQRIEGYPYGECVRAAYATILDLPLESVPRFDPAATTLAGFDQGDCERVWLSSIGLNLVEISVDPEDNLPQAVLDSIPENLPHLMSGVSPRGYGHRCVGVGGEVFFDPHPSREGLVSVYAVGFLVPLVPFI
jgi:hypothetical protein